MKRLRELELPPGYRTRQEPSGHLTILRPDGEPLRSECGMPIRVSCSPSDWRTRKNERKRIERAIGE